MLFLLFQIGNDRYALEARQAVEVLPLVSLKKIPQSPRGVAGIFNYRGRPVPAIDLSDLTFGSPARERLSTRIILIQHTDASGQPHLLGLIAEHATEMMRREQREFVDAGVRSGTAPYLGPVLMDEKGVIQLLHAQHLLAEKVRDLLLAPETGLSHETG
jgi:chemotaxis-related protein WspB